MNETKTGIRKMIRETYVTMINDVKINIPDDMINMLCNDTITYMIKYDVDMYYAMQNVYAK